jgi:hypothetical protein
MTTAQERLKKILQVTGWKISRLAMEIKTPEQTVRCWLKGYRDPTAKAFRPGIEGKEVDTQRAANFDSLIAELEGEYVNGKN